jgi:hypothetical protein
MIMMENTTLYLILSVIILIAVVVIFFVNRKQMKRLTPMAGLAFAFITAGIIFGEERWLGYSLLGIGVVLAIIDAVNKVRTAHK